MNALSKKLLLTFSILGGAMTHALAQKQQMIPTPQSREELLFYSKSVNGYYITTALDAADRKTVTSYSFDKNKQLLCVEDDITFVDGNTVHRTSCIKGKNLNIGTIQKMGGKIITQKQVRPMDGIYKINSLSPVVAGMMADY